MGATYELAFGNLNCSEFYTGIKKFQLKLSNVYCIGISLCIMHIESVVIHLLPIISIN